MQQEYQLQMVTLDPHGPSDLRANNTLANDFTMRLE